MRGTGKLNPNGHRGEGKPDSQATLAVRGMTSTRSCTEVPRILSVRRGRLRTRLVEMREGSSGGLGSGPTVLYHHRELTRGGSSSLAPLLAAVLQGPSCADQSLVSDMSHVTGSDSVWESRETEQ